MIFNENKARKIKKKHSAQLCKFWAHRKKNGESEENTITIETQKWKWRWACKSGKNETKGMVSLSLSRSGRRKEDISKAITQTPQVRYANRIFRSILTLSSSAPPCFAVLILCAHFRLNSDSILCFCSKDWHSPRIKKHKSEKSHLLCADQTGRTLETINAVIVCCWFRWKLGVFKVHNQWWWYKCDRLIDLYAHINIRINRFGLIHVQFHT